MTNANSIIETNCFTGRIPEFHQKRIERIREAIAIKSGTRGKPHKTIINTMAQQKEVCFKKPGKESFRHNNQNKHDMYPCIYYKGIN